MDRRLGVLSGRRKKKVDEQDRGVEGAKSPGSCCVTAQSRADTETVRMEDARAGKGRYLAHAQWGKNSTKVPTPGTLSTKLRYLLYRQWIGVTLGTQPVGRTMEPSRLKVVETRGSAHWEGQVHAGYLTGSEEVADMGVYRGRDGGFGEVGVGPTNFQQEKPFRKMILGQDSGATLRLWATCTTLQRYSSW